MGTPELPIWLVGLGAPKGLGLDTYSSSAFACGVKQSFWPIVRIMTLAHIDTVCRVNMSLALLIISLIVCMQLCRLPGRITIEACISGLARM